MHTEQYSPDPTLTPTQHHVLSLLAQGVSITEAAAAAGVHRNTVSNWRRTDPAFTREFEFAGRERSLYWHDQAVGLAGKAIEVLSSILHDNHASPSLRFRAAVKVISMAADPKPQPMKPFPTSAAEIEALHGRLLLLKATCAQSNSEIVHNSAQSCTTPQPNQPVRRAPEPGRNTPCPCKSGLKYKRCCGSFNRSPATSPQSQNEDTH